ncbi:MAG: hypothetical protein ABEJ56_01105, partial [Candidatus Nanohaloarchaea archaeon]
MSRDSLKRFLAASSVLLVLAASGAATDLQNIYSITPLGSNNISINGTIDLNGNNLTEPQRVDGIDLDNPGTGISVNSGRLEVTDNSIT